MQLLRRRGASGTGLQDVLDLSGAPRGSLYFHFPEGKEQLVREAIQEAAAAVDRWLAAALARHPSAAQAMAEFLRRYAEHMVETDFAEGCPIGAVTLDVEPRGDRLRSACDWALTGWVAVLAERLRGEGWPSEEAEALALTAVAALEGALILSRARRSADPLIAAARQM